MQSHSLNVKLNRFTHEFFEFFNGVSCPDTSWKVRDHRCVIISGLFTCWPPAVAHEIGNPLNALHIHLQLMERELKKFKAGAADSKWISRPRSPRPDREADRVKYRRKTFAIPRRGQRRNQPAGLHHHAIFAGDPPGGAAIKLVSLNDVVEKTLELLQPELNNRGLNVSAKSARQLPAAPADATQMQQVL